MKKKAVLTVTALLAVLVLGYFGYQWLSEKYRPENPGFSGGSTEASAENTAPQDNGEVPADTAAPDGTSEPEAAPDTEASEASTEERLPAEGDAMADMDAEGDAMADMDAEGDALAGNDAEGDALAEPAPDFTIYDEEGNEVRLSSFFGKPVIVNFWATWCGPCRQELPHFEELSQEYGDEVQFLMINLLTGGDTLEKVKEFIADNEYTFPVYYDTELNAAYTYGINAIPVTVAIAKDGSILGGYTGTLTKDVLMSMITALTAN